LYLCTFIKVLVAMDIYLVLFACWESELIDPCLELNEISLTAVGLATEITDALRRSDT
jgi:hypothetical protein